MVWTGPSFEPPDRPFDPEHPYADPAALIQQRQQKVREKLVRVEKAKVQNFLLMHWHTMQSAESMLTFKRVADV